MGPLLPAAIPPAYAIEGALGPSPIPPLSLSAFSEKPYACILRSALGAAREGEKKRMGWSLHPRTFTRHFRVYVACKSR